MATVGRRLRSMNEISVGDIVEVKSAEEILATLDERGELQSLPFMPEMLKFCGQRFVVAKIAYKTCDTANWTGMHRLENTVHLTGARCDGQAHGGCQAACMVFWKTDWLTRVRTSRTDPGTVLDGEGSTNAPDARQDTGSTSPAPVNLGMPKVGCTAERLDEVALGAYRTQEEKESADGPRYSCQATELPRSLGKFIPTWNIRQYVEDVQYGNDSAPNVIRGMAVGLFNRVQDVSRRVLPAKLRFRDGGRYPFFVGTATKTPLQTLDLQPGEWVRVKSADEISATLNAKYNNRGLYFDREMLLFCGRTARVLRRVDQIIDEATGRMITMKTPCIILSDAVCVGHFHRSCPRTVYMYWREIWLERVPAPERQRETELSSVEVGR